MCPLLVPALPAALSVCRQGLQRLALGQGKSGSQKGKPISQEGWSEPLVLPPGVRIGRKLESGGTLLWSLKYLEAESGTDCQAKCVPTSSSS